MLKKLNLNYYVVLLSLIPISIIFASSISLINISIIGMGYVGLPLACKFGSHYPTIGFDINNIRINQLKKHEDKTKEVSNSEIKNSKKLSFTSDEYLLKDSNIYIIKVPTCTKRFIINLLC